MSKVISSKCAADHPQCVEVEALPGGYVAVTDSKDQTSDHRGVVLTYTRAEWDAFVAGVKAGEFDYQRLTEARLVREFESYHLRSATEEELRALSFAAHGRRQLAADAPLIGA